MARRGQAIIRDVEPDEIYGHKLVTKLINGIMLDGKRSVAKKQIYSAFEKIRQDSKEEPLKVFLTALDQIKPQMEVRPRRVGGAAYQVPMPVRGTRRESLAIRWLIQAAQKRLNKEFHTFAEKLATEILEAAQGAGGAVGKKKDVERMAEANRAFAHFRW